jgi:3-oxoacyl-[acyl-carrier protein] reductase
VSARPDGAAVLVTGADRGIGAASAAELAADGWAVGILYRRQPEAAGAIADSIAAAGGRAIPVAADVTDPAACHQAFERVERELGPVLGLVNNAGVRADGLALSLPDADWDLVIETNLNAAFRLARLALRGMLRARFGRIVNVASVVGPRANAGQANYAAAKAGLIGLTKTLAIEVARKEVTVNAVAPGFIDTAMTADLPAATVVAVPARRAGRPEEVAACVRFLASNQAGYVTGTTLYVDGGLAA